MSQCCVLFSFRFENSITTFNPWSECLGQEKKIFVSLLISWQNHSKLSQNNKYDNDLLLRQETQKRLHVLEADIITITQVSVINHYHINGLHLFWDTMCKCYCFF